MRYHEVNVRWPLIKGKKRDSESGPRDPGIIKESADASDSLEVKDTRKPVKSVYDISPSMISSNYGNSQIYGGSVISRDEETGRGRGVLCVSINFTNSMLDCRSGRRMNLENIC